jgi:hypothetical protein
MAINLLERTTAALGYAPLKKIDPNTEKVKQEGAVYSQERLAQAVIPAVLAGISQLSKSEDGITLIATGSDSGGWPALIFGEHKEEVTGNIAAYAMSDTTTVNSEINKTAVAATRLIREEIKDTSGSYQKMKDFIKGQRDNILPYLPAELHIGNMLNNSTVDDATNKMEGPVSSLMHKIESTFGGNETKEDADRKSDNF